MAYFDSPKNKALWNRELNDLRKKKELRAQGLDTSFNEEVIKEQKQKDYETNLLNREPVTYKELLQEETEAVKQAKKSVGMTKKIEKTKEHSIDLHLNGPSL